MANFLMGTPSRFERIQRFDPQRQAAFDQILQQALSGLAGTQAEFGPIEEREVQRFQTETVPSLAERFTGMGARGSSAFQEALARGGGELGTSLAALGSQHALARQGQLMQLLGMGLTPQQEVGYFGGTPGLLAGAAPGVGRGLGSLLGALPGLIGTGAGAALGGPAGAAVGGAGGSALSRLFSSLFGGRTQQQIAPGSVVYQQPNV